MIEWRRRIVLATAFVVGLVALYTVAYQWALLVFEGHQTSLADSLQVVIEAFTTAGFGGHTDHWNSTAMNLFVVGMNLTGVLLVFLALPIFVVPLFQEAIADRPETETDLTDHVIICSYSPREDVLRSELEAADVPYVIVEEEPDVVLELNDEGIEAILGDPELEETFERANLDSARAVVADVSDERSVSVILTVRELGDDIDIVSIAESREDAVYHRYAGADHVIRPRQVLGHSLAEKVTLSVTRELRDTIEIGDDFEISELVVKGDSDLAGKTIAEAGLRDRIGATIIGAWSNGEFVPTPEPDMRIEGNTILLVAGSHEELEEVTSRTIAPNGLRDGQERVVVAGHGIVGRSVAKALDEAGLPHTVVDTDKNGSGVDVVGDITDPTTLLDAEIKDADIVVLALDDDTETMYTTVVLERITPETEVIARANEIENTGKLYRAGAEYVLALSTVTGRMLSTVLLEDEEVLSPETQFEIIRTSAPDLAGRTLEAAGVRERTGATVVAVERNGDLVTNPGPEFRVRRDDMLVVTGSDTAVNEFIKLVR
ncbi:Trk K+ transport system, NAD-binding component [Halobiforma haloterrestris]|uniref:Trk K+ transport system, NAD-binding component n=1 Tax=Natronobacterium haloterrestre TaxID=148448 RepID=A0A1I1FJ36_NATHA|nr:potassium channel protein [Halobiforma haloterrestris]SFB97113.1 Trk K+ transport system, NAD-binding component [Halobiforma haloterrestris]